MPKNPELIPLDFLLNASKMSLEDAMLNRLADASNRSKQIVELLETWAERKAEVLLLQWFLSHGNELMATVTLTPTLLTEGKTYRSDKSAPLSAEEFRERLRSLVES